MAHVVLATIRIANSGQISAIVTGQWDSCRICKTGFIMMSGIWFSSMMTYRQRAGG